MWMAIVDDPKHELKPCIYAMGVPPLIHADPCQSHLYTTKRIILKDVEKRKTRNTFSKMFSFLLLLFSLSFSLQIWYSTLSVYGKLYYRTKFWVNVIWNLTHDHDMYR